MNTTDRKNEYVSALPMRPGEVEGFGFAAEDAGIARLKNMLDYARAQSAALAPLVVPRFDGVDRTMPDEADLQAKLMADATVALVDCILSDVTLRLRVTAKLARYRV